MMRGRRAGWTILGAALMASACTDAGPAQPDDMIGLQADLYLNAVLDIMEANSVRRNEIDWPAFREETLADAVGAETTEDTHPVIAAALERIGDGHSFFRSPVLDSERQVDVATLDPSADRLGEVGYVDVTPFSGGGPDADSVATTYHRLLEEVEAGGPVCGWVVDLRGNTGGNMWPMIAGVGPLLGEGEVGFFIEPDSTTQTWGYEAGGAGLDGGVVSRSVEPHTLTAPDPFVAVLTDSLTASSGEAVAIAFRGRADTRSFGEPTWGVSTANRAFPLIDGAVLFLTVSTMGDRTGTVYGDEVEPDELVIDGSKTGEPGNDLVLDAALTWLAGGPCV